MIPLDVTAVVLPRMASADLVGSRFPLNIVKAPLVDFRSRTRTPAAKHASSPIIRILQSRNQRRNSSASSVQSFQTSEIIFSGKSKEVCSAKLIEWPSFPCVLGTETNEEVMRKRISSGSHNSKPGGQDIISNSSKSLEIAASTSDPCLHYTEMANSTESKAEMEKKAHDQNQIFCKSSNTSITHTESRNSPTKNDTSISKKIKPKQKKMLKRQKKLNTARKKKSGSSNNVKKINTGREPIKSLWCSTQKLDSKPSSKALPIKHSTSIVFNVKRVHTTYTAKKNNLFYLPNVSNPTRSFTAGSVSSSQRQKSDNLSKGVSSGHESVRTHFVYNEEKLKKVYLSNAQSRMLMSGAPSAPPPTPTPEQLKLVEYIPSLTDIKSQRAVKARLTALDHKLKITERRKKEKELKDEQRKACESVLQLKEQQRNEIYALNKLMTALENANFEKFMKDHQALSLPV